MHHRSPIRNGYHTNDAWFLNPEVMKQQFYSNFLNPQLLVVIYISLPYIEARVTNFFHPSPLSGHFFHSRSAFTDCCSALFRARVCYGFHGWWPDPETWRSGWRPFCQICLTFQRKKSENSVHSFLVISCLRNQRFRFNWFSLTSNHTFCLRRRRRPPRVRAVIMLSHAMGLYELPKSDRK